MKGFPIIELREDPTGRRFYCHSDKWNQEGGNTESFQFYGQDI